MAETARTRLKKRAMQATNLIFQIRELNSSLWSLPVSAETGANYLRPATFKPRLDIWSVMVTAGDVKPS